jgi:UDP-N-acetylmuramate dehydrogenase
MGEFNMIQTNVALSDKNWFQTGGTARFFCEPKNLNEFKFAIKFGQDQNLPIFILGAGANVLISDDGFDGLVIRPKITNISFVKTNQNHVLVTAGAGVLFADLINSCFENNTLGLEEFSGIPGTVGGSVFINLHFFKFLLSQFLVSATVVSVKNQETLVVDQNWFNFGYNQSRLQDQDFYLVDATFQLKSATDLEVAYAKGRSHEMIRYRTWRYPAKNTCGSFFRNFYESEVNLELDHKKMIFVAYYLDKLGFKGSLKVGNASVSHQHANMLVTQPGAKSSDLIELVRIMQLQVFEKFGVLPQPECLLIGFKDYPLIKLENLNSQTSNSQKLKSELANP